MASGHAVAAEVVREVSFGGGNSVGLEKPWPRGTFEHVLVGTAFKTS